MIRLVAFCIALALLVAGLAWLADRPGEMVVNWLGVEMQPTVFQAVVALGLYTVLVLVGWTLLQQVASAPSSVSGFFRRKRQQQGLEALSAGMIAIGAGDKPLAARFALQARRSLPNEPLTDLLRAETALLIGDGSTARRIYEAMLQSPDTELLGLRGLFLEAEKAKETVAARQFAERAVKRNPKLAWASDALFNLQCRQGDLEGALQSLALARRNDHVDKKTADRKRAVLLTGLAQKAEETEADKALGYAQEAVELAPGLVPAAVIAGRILASRGKPKQAAAVIEKTWKVSPHPELAHVYAFARPGDSPRDRLARVKTLANMTPSNREAPIAVALAAIDARDWQEARLAVEPLAEDGLSQRICVLMARIEGGDKGDTGRVREWLARAIHVPRDPAWMADGRLFDHWAPVSPATGEIDAFRWQVPDERMDTAGSTVLLEELNALSGNRLREARLGGRAVDADETEALRTTASKAQAPAEEPRSGWLPSLVGRNGADAGVASSQRATSGAREAEPKAAQDTARAPVTAQSRRAVADADVDVVTTSRASSHGDGRGAERVAASGARERDADVYLATHAPDDPGPVIIDGDEPLARTARQR